ncbi:MAG: alpha/beta hydrolase [Pseudomonadota bacterium]
MKYLFDIKNFCVLFFVCFFLSGCQTYVLGRHKAAERIGERYHMTQRLVKGDKFWLMTYQRITNPQAPFVVYIEGDGYAFKTKYTISEDPTPIRPMLLRLAAEDTRQNVVYIARPCQYTMEMDKAVCDESYWSDKRMSDEVVRSINDVIIELTNKAPVRLVGFSGGGGIAVLVAARNPQVRSILTIAGNLDHVAFNNYHDSRPMLGSLNPIDYVSKVRNIPQLHFSGGIDKIVPPFIGDKFVQAANSPCVHQEVIPDVEHREGWERRWDYILSAPIKCY